MMHLSIINIIFETLFLREQRYYNNGHQEVVTSVHFMKSKRKFAKPLGFKLRPSAGHTISINEIMRGIVLLNETSLILVVSC